MTGLWVMATGLATAVSFAGVQLVTSSVIRPVVPIVEHDEQAAPSTIAPSPTTSSTVSGGGASPVRTTAPVSPTTAPPPAVTRAPADQGATYATQGGFVTVRCRGNAIQLVSATPRDGWRLDVKDTGPERVRVRFIGTDRYVELFAVCKDGVPTRFSRNEPIDDNPPRTTQPTRPPGDGGGPGPGGDGRR